MRADRGVVGRDQHLVHAACAERRLDLTEEGGWLLARAFTFPEPGLQNFAALWERPVYLKVVGNTLLISAQARTSEPQGTSTNADQVELEAKAKKKKKRAGKGGGKSK